MTLRRVHQAAIAAASDGSVLINVISLLPAALRDRIGKELGGSQAIFVGVPLAERDAGDVVARLDDAAAEASAVVLGRGRAKAITAKKATKSSR